MKQKKKIWGFRSGKPIIRLLACLYYAISLALLFFAITKNPEIITSAEDQNIYKITNILLASLLFLPPIFFSDWKGKKNTSFKKSKKWWNKCFGFLSTFILVLSGALLISSTHTKAYQTAYEEYLHVEKTSNPSNKSKETLEENLNELTNQNEETESPKTEQNATLKVHYFDVGQGDSIFIELPNQQTMLIDAAESEEKEKIEEKIKNLGYQKIDYIIATHPHTDHIGGMAYIIEHFEVGDIYMPKAVATSKTYENLLETIKNQNKKIKIASDGVTILNQEDLEVKFIAPKQEDYAELNNYSAVVKLTYKEKKFLFMGDAETKSEEEITEDVKADVIKVGHHGSDTSSKMEFVNKVRPTYAIISVGKNNKYNHPNEKIIKRWEDVGATILQTAEVGDITITSNGETLDCDKANNEMKEIQNKIIKFYSNCKKGRNGHH